MIQKRMSICCLLLVFALMFSACHFVPNSDIQNPDSESTTLSQSEVPTEGDTTVTEPEEPEETQPTPEEEDPYAEVNLLRPDYNWGSCKNLRGKVAVLLLFIDDFESAWSTQSVANFINNEIKPGFAFLEKEAQKYGVELEFSIVEIYQSRYYDDKVITNTNETGMVTIDVMYKTANSLGFPGPQNMLDTYSERYDTDEVLCFTVFNKSGTSYAIDPKKDSPYQTAEHCVLFVRDLNSNGNDPAGSQASVIAHCVLYLYGAENFYKIASRKTLASLLYPDDIMLTVKYNIQDNAIGDATAFYIGWTHTPPDILYNANWN